MSDPFRLVTFLLARIGEDEQLAREAAGDFPDWVDSTQETFDGENVYFTVTATRSPGTKEAAWEPDYFLSIAEDNRDDARVGHIARHDPARVLAECEAKRWVVELHEYAYDDNTYRYVLRLLALPYADHPDYREEWRP